MNLTLKLRPLCGFNINISASVLGVSVSCWVIHCLSGYFTYER